MRFLLPLLFFAFVTIANAANIGTVNSNLTSGLFNLPGSPFSVLIYNEGALGNYLGIVLTGQWSKYGSKEWKLGDRYWYEEDWGDDVTSYYFHVESGNLYIATSGYYGKAGVYCINLKEKNFIKLNLGKEPVDSQEGSFLIKSRKDGILFLSYTGPITSFEVSVNLLKEGTKNKEKEQK